MRPERARYGVVAEGDLGGMRSMLLAEIGWEEHPYGSRRPVWVVLPLVRENDDAIRHRRFMEITLGPTNAWREVTG